MTIKHTILLTLAAALLAGAATPALAGGGVTFVAHIDESQIIPPTGSPATGLAFLRPRLVNGEWRLKYEIQLNGVDLDGFVTRQDASDDITHIHLHNAPAGANGPHALNIYRIPCEDDPDIVVTPFAGLVTGYWDEGDLTDTVNCPGLPASFLSMPLSAMFDELCHGNLYVNVHSTDFPAGVIRGQLQPVFWKDDNLCVTGLDGGGGGGGGHH